jgi:arginyl-tRNA synthetase
LVEKVEVAGPGFLNIWLKNEWFIRQLEKVLKEGEKYGKAGILAKKRLMIEYAHPNTHKEFHIGHLRNISLGESLVRIFEACGAEVIRTNYQGDVGLHIAKCLFGIKKLGMKDFKSLEEKVAFLGKAYVEGNKAYEEDKKAKKEILDLNEAIYKKDKKIMALWQKTRQWSLDYFERIYKRVDSKFDRHYFESEVVEGIKIAKEALKKGILKKSEGAIIFDGTKYGLDKRVFINKYGFPTYEAKELKLAELEFSEFGKIDKLIHVVGPEQKSFFAVTFKVEELLNEKKYKDKQCHLVYGWVRLKKGKMSSRLGNVVRGEWLLDEAKNRIKKAYPDVGEEVAEMAAVGAAKYSFLKVQPTAEIAFDFDESISLQGNSGPYLQYTFARCQSVLAKASKVHPRGGHSATNKEELAILRWLYRYPEVIEEAGEKMAPNFVCGYLYALAQRYNTFYNKHRVIGNDFRLNLTLATSQLLKNGLYLLGIKNPEKM